MRPLFMSQRLVSFAVFSVVWACAEPPNPSQSPPLVVAEMPLVSDPIDWPKARQAPTLSGGAARYLPQDLAESVPLPVLLPDDPALLAVAQWTQGPAWYAVAMPLPDHMVYVMGHSSGFDHPSLAQELRAFSQNPPQGAAQGEVFATITHQIPSVSVRRFGASYLVEIECAHPASDPRCADLSAVRALANGLKVASQGGEP